MPLFFPDHGTLDDRVEAYQKLIQNLKALIEREDTSDLQENERREELICRGCRAGRRKTSSGADTGHIIVEAKKRDYVSRGRGVCLKTYSFICLACGLWQQQIFKEVQGSGTFRRLFKRDSS